MVTRPGLAIRLKRHADGSASITLTRGDGTVTWQRQSGSLALVFPSHDLTHYAVEQTMGYGSAFYGLVADGWDIPDFGTPWPRGPIPDEAREAEMVVGLFDGMRRDRGDWSAATLNTLLAELVASSKYAHSLVPRRLSDEDVARVRARRDALLDQWAATAQGSSLELTFSRR